MSSVESHAKAPLLKILSTSESHSFIAPVKKINDGQDISHFLTSRAYSDIMTFLLQLNRAMFPRKIPPSPGTPAHIQVWDLGTREVLISKTVRRLQDVLGELEKFLDEIPLDTGPRRFGNVSFRTWYQKVEEQAPSLLQSHLPDFPIKAVSGVREQDELFKYFLGSFGSAQRLDYGSGHELSFLAFLGCIWKLGGFKLSSDEGDCSEEDQLRGIVLNVFQDYLQLIRRLIKTYTLEPAGSHGVWGLDDHSFIPYIFGSAQYGPAISDADETPIEGSREGAPDPGGVATALTVDRYSHSNLYFDAIGFIHDVKKGPFWEHSPMLFDISGVKGGWGKINKGMVKMYNAEVLCKFPVVQHFPFGSLFSWETDPNAPPPPHSIHASSQPFALNNGVESSSGEKVAAPRPAQEGTKAPWAATATSQPASGLGTAAPWASRPPTNIPAESRSSPRAPSPDSGTPYPTRLPPPASYRNLRQPGPSSTETARPENPAAMPPPPTRAPWAKGP